MITDPHILEQIDRFLSGKMKGEERTIFQKKLQNDPELQETLELQHAANQAVIHHKLSSVASMMKQDFSKNDFPGETKNLNKKIFTISSVLIVSATIAGWLLTGSEENNQLVQQVTRDTTGQEYSLTIKDKEHTTILTPDKKEGTTEKQAIQLSSGKLISNNPAKISEDSLPDKDIPVEKNTHLDSSANTKEEILKSSHYKETAPISTKAASCDSIRAEVSTSPSCEKEPTGSIQIIQNSIRGGTAPYKIFIHHSDEKIFEANNFNYSNISAGSYTIRIRDAHGCETKLPKHVEVKTKNCNVPDVHTIHPEYGESARIMLEDDEQGTLEVYSMGGILIYSTFTQNNDYVEWDGTNNQGGKVSNGTYIYYIKSGTEILKLGKVIVY